MGTAEQRAHRQGAVAQRERVVQWMRTGAYHSDDDLRAFLQSIGANPAGALFSEFSGGGGAAGSGQGGGLYEMYGPSADPMKTYDLQSGKFQWKITNDDGSLKYPDWNPIDPTELGRIKEFYAWRTSPEGLALAKNYGGSSIAAWYATQDPKGSAFSRTKNGQGGVGGSALGGAGGTSSSFSSMFGGGPLGSALGGAFQSQADLNAELSRQARLDTLNQQFQYERAANEYAGAQPLEKYLTDLYGDVLGVKFDQPNFSLSDYFSQGMQGMGGQGGGTSPMGDLTNYHNPDGSIDWNRYFNDHPDDSPAYTGGSQPGTGNNPGDPGNHVIFDENGNPTTPTQTGWLNQAMGGRAANRNPQMYGANAVRNPTRGPAQQVNPAEANRNPVMQPTQQVDPNAPWDGQVQEANRNPSRLPAQGVGGRGQLGPGRTPSVPTGSYSQSGNAYNPNNPSTWAFLAQPAQQVAGDFDNARAQIQRMMPEGGEKNLALAQTANNAYGQVAGLRQGLVSQALAGISGLAGAKKGFNPGGYSGGAQSLLNSSDTQRGQDVSRYGIDRGFQGGLMDLYNRNSQNSSNGMNSLFSGLGNLLSNSDWFKNLGS